MSAILLVGAAFNFFGAVPLLAQAVRMLATAPSRADASLPLMFFSAGTAVVFGSMYVYLFFHTTYVMPFLIFGAALKTWAFILSRYLYSKQRVSRQTFLQFGVGNGAIAALFWWYLIDTAFSGGM